MGLLLGQKSGSSMGQGLGRLWKMGKVHFDDLWSERVNFDNLRSAFRDQGCKCVYVKPLAANDNSKNQIFVGNDLSEVSSIPTGDFELVLGTSEKRRSSGSIVRASIDLQWISEGCVQKALEAKLIFYPQYPEVRLSGILRGSSLAPSELLNPKKRGREPGRLLLLGVNKKSQSVFAVVLSAEAIATAAVKSSLGETRDGIFSIWNLDPSRETASQSKLLNELQRIHEMGWIDGQRLSRDGLIPYQASNGGGYTLEAQLGIYPNGFSAPDFLGWEVKQHGVKNFNRPSASRVTLFTPEPDSGVYVEDGLEKFLRSWGKARAGSARLDFTGKHSFGIRSTRTGLLLAVNGFSRGDKTFDAAGGIELIATNTEVAARWSFEKLLKHWKRKHSNAVYVPSITRTVTCNSKTTRQYMYGAHVHLGKETTFQKFLDSLLGGDLFYDPGIHMTPGVETKKRNQFRLSSRLLSDLYENYSEVDVYS
jgi:hypothetical protein